MRLAEVEPHELPTIPAVVPRGVKCPENAPVCSLDLRIMSDADATREYQPVHYSGINKLKNSPSR